MLIKRINQYSPQQIEQILFFSRETVVMMKTITPSNSNQKQNNHIHYLISFCWYFIVLNIYSFIC
jgi:hypothetical protein